MPGTPPTSPVFGAPRYDDDDTASFSASVNAITDTFDEKAVLNTDARLTNQRTPSDGSVTTAKLADGAVTTGKLVDASIVHQTGDLIVSVASSRIGCLLCDGSPFDPTTYPLLFSTIGAEFGTDSGTGHPLLPDYRGRVIVGTGNGPGLTPRPIGQKGGEETHQLTVSEMPSHSHTDAGHQHSFTNPAGTFGPAIQATTGTGFSGATQETGVGEANIENTGGGGAHNNMPPYGTANVFIKT